jgi:hypothetical protein
LNVSRIAAENGFRIVKNRVAGGLVIEDISARGWHAWVVDAIDKSGDELRMVQKVEELSGELYFRSFTYAEVLE